jgi:hypothetical protein
VARDRWRRLVELACVTSVAGLFAGVVGCSGDSTPTPEVAATGTTETTETGASTSTAPSPSGKTDSGYPNSLVVLGHSGATGYNSDPDQPGVELRTNSWATGTNPEVNSVYLRILAKNPTVEGHAFNLAQGGATIDDLVAQARQAVARKPDLIPDVILIQIGDNDVVCPATKDDLKRFRTTFESALELLAEALPSSHMFVVSQFGRPATYATALTSAEREFIGGTGPCDVLDFSGRLVRAKAARLEDTIHDYDAQLAAGCGRFRQCRYDEGAFANVRVRREYLSSDFDHLSVEGLAKAAAVAWTALERAGVVPRSG